MGEFRMPSLGADMEAGTLVEWLVEPGQTVARGDIVAIVETEKSTIEVEIFEAGVVAALLVEEGTKVPVGTALATVGSAAASPAVAQPQPDTEPEPEAAGVAAVLAGAPSTPPAEQPAGTVTSPLVRRLAHERGIDLAELHGSGRGGIITRADVERQQVAARAEGTAAPALVAAAPVAAPSPARRRVSPYARRLSRQAGVDLSALQGGGPGGAILAADVEQVTSHPAPAQQPLPPPAARGDGATDAAERKAAMRRAIGALMARSKREIPHYYLGASVDMSTALAWLGEQNQDRPVPARLLPAVLLLKAAALAARDFPALNGFWTDDGYQPSDHVHLGVAVSLRGGGLIAPAIHDADEKSLDDVMADLRDLVTRARAGRLRSSEMSDPTITVTNLGEQGVETVYGVIYRPQVALVGFGKIVERPWAHEGMIGARPVVHATLAADHRVTDGHTGGLFLAAVDRHLQLPEEL
jgi:pyruvate dehydrogenase E2 component (dihydrolipoamide acetyltransferase)